MIGKGLQWVDSRKRFLTPFPANVENTMKVYTAVIGTCCVVTACLAMLGQAAKSDNTVSSVDANVRRMNSPGQQEREDAVKCLGTEYDAMAKSLYSVLAKASVKEKEDRGYYSSLHCAILAIAKWRVFAAEDILLSIVDYQLKPSTLPSGLTLYGKELFPAVGALVRLRVERKKIIGSMKASKSARTLSALTWIYLERSTSASEGIAALEMAMGACAEGEKNNLEEAIAAIKKSQVSLPTLVP